MVTPPVKATLTYKSSLKSASHFVTFWRIVMKRKLQSTQCRREELRIVRRNTPDAKVFDLVET